MPTRRGSSQLEQAEESRAAEAEMRGTRATGTRRRAAPYCHGHDSDRGGG